MKLKHRSMGHGLWAAVTLGMIAQMTLLQTALWAAPTLTGVVLNTSTGQPVRGATLEFEGVDTLVTSDLDGLVTVALPVGTYVATVKMDGFKPQRVTDIEVTANGGNFAVVLEPTSAEGTEVISDEITVTAEAARATEVALLTERKNAVQISDSIGSEEMSKTTGSDAAGVLKRVTGVSLQDNKYVYVRGLGDRYSSTTLNGSKLPSTEFEKKVVPLDLFPSGLIEKITVSKSYTVDKPSDFAAGFVELSTVDFPARRTAAFDMGISTNSETTGDDYLEYPGGLGFSGSGGQSLASSFTSDPLVPLSPITGEGFTEQELESIGESIGGFWRPAGQGNAPLNRSFKASYGQSAGRLGMIVSANYSNSWSTRDEERTIYQGTGDGGLRPLNTYRFDSSDEKVRQALAGNLAYRFGNNHHLRVKSIFTTLASGEARFQEGFFSDISNNIEDFRISYRDQEITNIQLSGDHFFPSLGGNGSLLEWKLSMSEATTDENRRQTLYEEIRPGFFRLTDNAQSGFLYFNALDDQLDDIHLHWSTFFSDSKRSGTIKAGLAHTTNDREFVGRRLRFFQRSSANIDLTLSPEELFVPEFIGPNGFQIQEITRPTDTYGGEHVVEAGYIQADVAFGKWRLIGGLRFEDSQQDVITFDRNNQDSPPVFSEVDNADILPALNLVYSLGDSSNLRFSASQTLNRPEYRELAPFKFTHVVGGFAVTGNPDLERAKITSVDTRWEWFPSGGEVIAASIFYKDFDRPIENVLLAGAELLETFQNVNEAQNFGVELEMRRNLGSFHDGLKNWSVVLNYTYVESEITLDSETTVLTNIKRPLVGQPDNVFNAILEWNKPRWGSLARVLYNFTDNKISRAGGFGQPDVFEDSRGTVDVIWGQSLNGWLRGLEVKFSGTNIFDEERLWSQGGQIFRLYDPGRSFNFSVAYKPFSN